MNGLKEDLLKIKFLIVDVDGTMTDGGIYYDNKGNELKKFNTRDAAGFFAAKNCGIKTIVITGRESLATTKRMQELQVDYVVQNVKDKLSYLIQFMKDNNISKTDLGYIGDDLNDLASMQLTGFIGCPADACEEIISVADYVSPKKGGEGAVRDIISYILTKREQWEEAIKNVYNIGM